MGALILSRWVWFLVGAGMVVGAGEGTMSSAQALVSTSPLRIDANGQPDKASMDTVSGEAEAVLENRARLGDGLAAFEVAGRYWSGTKGVAQDAKQALANWEIAGQAGIPVAQVDVARLYEGGKNVPADMVKAKLWWGKVATNASTPASLEQEAALRYGNLLAMDLGAEKPDFPASVMWLQKAVDLGSLDAMNLLGFDYLKGRGVPVDTAKAFALQKQAADGGVASAEFNVGWFYETGTQVREDFKVAIEWFLKASRLNYIEADSELARLQMYGRGTPVDFAKAREFARKIETDGDASRSHFLLAEIAKAEDAERAQKAAKEKSALAEAERKTTSEVALVVSQVSPSLVLPMSWEPDGSGFRVASGFTGNDILPVPRASVTDWTTVHFTSVEDAYRTTCFFIEASLPCIKMHGKFSSTMRGTPQVEVQILYFLPGTSASTIGTLFDEIAKRLTAVGSTAAIDRPTPKEIAEDKHLLKTQVAEYKREHKGPSMFGAILSGVVDAAAPLTANADPNAIQNTANQQVADIQAKQAQAQAAQAAAAQRQAQAAQAAEQRRQEQIAAQQQAQEAAQRQAARVPPSTTTAVAANSTVNTTVSQRPASSGTAAPPVCADLGVNGNPNCITPAQSQQMQRQQQANMQTCPASGTVSGKGYWAACDAYMGERVACTPGQQVPIIKPAAAPASCGPAQSSGDQGASGGVYGPPEAACIRITTNADGYPVFTNTCSIRLRYFWTPLHPSKGEFAEQNGYLDPGQTDTGAEAKGEEVRVYACQDGYLVVGPDNRAITGVVAGYRCLKP